MNWLRMWAMPEPGERTLVTNTTPLIALTAATGRLDVRIKWKLVLRAGMNALKGLLR